ncbi:MAG: hypothetical protein ABUL60_17450 [Myxococcales bacterium]
MARFGRRAGCVGFLLLSWLAGCNNGDDSSSPETSRPSAGGGATSVAVLEQGVGRVLVVGESGKVENFEREYRGLAHPGQSDADLVRCEVSSSSEGYVVSIEAAQGSSSTLQLAAHLAVPSLGPATFEITPDDADENAVRVRLGEGKGANYYEYQLDGSEDPISLCSVGFTTFDRNGIVGIAACRRLGATSSSLDATAQGGDSGSGSGSASVTFDFSCPFETLAAPGGGGSTSSGTGGKPSGAGGTGHAGATPGGSGNVGGSGVVEKHCVGVTTPCTLRDSVTCELGNGCTLDEGCSGFSESCYGQIGVYTCTAIQGCLWASSSQSCIGSAWSCSSFSGSFSCTDQPGCSWRSDCTGVAPLCSSLTEFTCALESGCRWE